LGMEQLSGHVTNLDTTTLKEVALERKKIRRRERLFRAQIRYTKHLDNTKLNSGKELCFRLYEIRKELQKDASTDPYIPKKTIQDDMLGAAFGKIFRIYDGGTQMSVFIAEDVKNLFGIHVSISFVQEGFLSVDDKLKLEKGKKVHKRKRKIFICKRCKRQFLTKRSLWHHIHFMHTEKGGIRSRRKVRKYRRYRPIPGTEIIKWQCPWCTRGFISEEPFRNHFRNFSHFVCDICTEKFHKKSQLYQHRKEKHNEEYKTQLKEYKLSKYEIKT